MSPTNATAAIDPDTLHGEFCSQRAKRSIRVTCYGSSSAKTPQPYLRAARDLGYTLAKRGHICVNGAGSFGCMAAMNDGAVLGNGHIVGVIHEMFVVDNWGDRKVSRDGGAHAALTKSASNSQDGESGPIREILVARGKDLQQRKRLLVENAESLVVLPGGPGTWDELWEMACARHLGLVQLPIVCINVDAYYEPFRAMLQRAHKEELVKLRPEDIVHFASTVEEAVRWIEIEVEKSAHIPNFDRASSELNRSSFFSPPSRDTPSSLLSTRLFDGSYSSWFKSGSTFLGGVALGIFIAYSTSHRSRFSP
eukprot:scaffold52_cov183-Cylindrotheca_fusiformis.AAC.4